MITKMEDLQERITAISAGGLIGMLGGFKIWGIGINLLYWEFPLKLVGTTILAAIGGIVGLMARDFYQHKIKTWWIKKIKNDK